MIYFIRHAQSTYNSFEEQIKQKYGDQFRTSQQFLSQCFTHKNMIDAQITSLGIKQAEEAKKQLEDTDFDLIIVSPLRRALHTCSIIFDGHKSKAQVIVEPVFRQIIQTVDDIGSQVQESMQKYKTYDFTHIQDKEAWYLNTLICEEDRLSIAQKITGTEGNIRKQRCIEQLLKLMKQNWLNRIQYPEQEEFYKQRMLPSYQKQRQIIRKYQQKYSKIAIVAHSQCIKRYTGYITKNCEVVKIAMK